MAETAKRKVLVALDGSEHSRHAFDFAIAKVFHPGKDTVLLLHVLPNNHPAGDDTLLEEYRSLAESKGLEAVKISEHGDAREVIVRTAEKEDADLLVIGSHGKGLTKRLLLGSVSDYCAHNCPCPVLVHRPAPKS